MMLHLSKINWKVEPFDLRTPSSFTILFTRILFCLQPAFLPTEIPGPLYETAVRKPVFLLCLCDSFKMLPSLNGMRKQLA